MTEAEKAVRAEYDQYVSDSKASGHFVLNFMNWMASRKYESNKEKFQAHFVEMHRRDEEMKQERAARNLERENARQRLPETPA